MKSPTSYFAVLVSFPGSRFAVVCCLLIFAAASNATDGSGDTVDGGCPDTLAPLEERARAANDPTLLELLATCNTERGRFAAAAEALERLTGLVPSSALFKLRLAIARFHSGDFKGAEDALAGADDALAERADFHLYRGLLARQRGAHAEAAKALDRARRIDPGAVEPIASFYAAKAWRALGERSRALEALGRVQNDWPGTPWAGRARRESEDLTGRWSRHFWLSAEGGMERDNNVVLRNRGVQLPSEISDQRDWRGTWRLRAASELARRWGFNAGAAVSYEGSAHLDLDAFDMQYPTLTLWADRSVLEDWRLRLRYDFGFLWFDTDPYLASHEIAAEVERRWGRWGASEISIGGGFYDFRFSNQEVPDGLGATGSPCPGSASICGPPGIDESRARDRDGAGLRLRLDHRLPLPLPGGDLRVGYGFENFGSDGREYRFVGNEVRARLALLLPLSLQTEVSGRARQRDFRHPSTFPEPDSLFLGLQYPLARRDRRDREFEIGAQLERAVARGVSAGVRWRYLRNRSNVAVFDYRQQVVGLYLRLDSSGLWP